MKGTIVKDEYGNATITFTYQWNDRIHPNFIYDFDSKKAKFAKSIPFTNPTNYIIRISWTDTSVLNSNGIFSSGRLSKDEPIVVGSRNSSKKGIRK